MPLRTPNEYNVRGGVERAFMSTTRDREVAMAYAAKRGDEGAQLVFEFTMGAVDRGADLGWLSQCASAATRTLVFPPAFD